MLVRNLTTAALSAAGISYRQQEALFNPDSPELKGLTMLASEGLRTDTSIAASVIAAIEHLENVKLKPLLRDVIADKVPLAVLYDESTAKTDGRRSWMSVFLFAATWPEPVAFDVFIVHKAGTAVNLAEAITASLTRPGFLTAGEMRAFVKIGATDHASAVLKACKELGIVSSGDAPHAVELVVKRLLRALGLRVLLMKFRAIFTRKNSTAFNRLLEAFGIPLNTFQMCVRGAG